ncbi:MAG: hypothetical protein V3S08_09000 [Phycisphaerales bacterium]
MIRLLVDSQNPNTAVFLRGRLDADRIRIFCVEVKTDFMDMARRVQPDIAVIDGIHERQETARARITALKAINPGVRIIAVSGHSSALDVRVVELGVFYYLTLAAGDELVRIIEAAAGALGSAAPTRNRDLGAAS